VLFEQLKVQTNFNIKTDYFAHTHTKRQAKHTLPMEFNEILDLTSKKL